MEGAFGIAAFSYCEAIRARRETALACLVLLGVLPCEVWSWDVRSAFSRMHVSGDQALSKHLLVDACLVVVALGLDMLLMANSPDQTASGSEFNAAGQKNTC